MNNSACELNRANEDAHRVMSSRISFPDWVPVDHPARTVLARNVDTRWGPVAYRLVERDEYSANIPVWETQLGTRLIAIGEFDRGYQLLFLASDGRCFSADIVAADVFHYHAASLFRFHLMLLFRRRSRPMLRPDQSEVISWGITFKRESPEVYDPATSQKRA